MKRMIVCSLLAVWSCITALAQTEDIRRAAQRYDGVQTLTAQVTQTHHNVAIAQDEVVKGIFSFKSPCRLCMSFDEVGEKLLTDGTTFVMQRDGKEQVAPKGYNPYAVLVTVLRTVAFSTDDLSTLTEVAQVDMQRQGNSCTLTITPVYRNNKAKRRSPFTSFVVTLDLKAGELSSLLMNGRGGNYTRYDFHNYKSGVEIPDEIFQSKAL